MSEMTMDNQIPANLVEAIEIMLAVGGLSPAQYATFRKAAARIEELEAACSSCYDAQQRAQEEVERLQRKYDALVDGSNRLISKWREGDFDLSDYVRGKMDGCHQCAKELRALMENDDE